MEKNQENDNKRQLIDTRKEDSLVEVESIAEKLHSKEFLHLLKDKYPQEYENFLGRLQSRKVIHKICQVEHHEGPIPHPEALKEYDNVSPGLAEKIVSMAEKEQSHRHDLNKTALISSIKEKKLGQIFALTIGITALLSSLAAIFLGSSTVAGIIGGSTVVGLVTVFVIGKKMDKKKEAKPETE